MSIYWDDPHGIRIRRHEGDPVSTSGAKASQLTTQGTKANRALGHARCKWEEESRDDRSVVLSLRILRFRGREVGDVAMLTLDVVRLQVHSLQHVMIVSHFAWEHMSSGPRTLAIPG